MSLTHPLRAVRNVCLKWIASSAKASCPVSNSLVANRHCQQILFANQLLSSSSSTRTFSSQSDGKDKESNIMSAEMEREMDGRHHGIMMNPKGLGRTILPGDFVIKTNEKTGSKRKVYADRAHGYFWMIKDLKDTDNKPILTSPSIIPVEKAKMFPSLTGNLSTLEGETVSLPEYITRLNRSEDEFAQCTLVTVSFNDYGYKLLPSWTEPFAEEVLKRERAGGRAQIIRIVINQGRIIQYLSRWVRSSFAKQNRNDFEHDTTLLFFGPECPQNFRDSLRMHNTMTGYVYLLDGLGRVRWAGSGSAENDDVEKIIRYAKDLTPMQNKPRSNHKGSKNRMNR